MGNERTALMENESRISDSSKSGNEGNFSLPLNNFSSSNRNYYRDKILQKISLIRFNIKSLYFKQPQQAQIQLSFQQKIQER